MPARLRRSVLAVPGSNPRMMEKAASSAADEVFLDLEDACVVVRTKDGKVRLKHTVDEADEMALDTRSTKTTRVKQ